MPKWASPKRIEIVFTDISEGMECALPIAQKRHYSVDSVRSAMRLLVEAGRIECCGYRQTGVGQPTKLYRVTTGEPVALNTVILEAPKPRVRRTGGGGIAGRIEIGRGARWFA